MYKITEVDLSVVGDYDWEDMYYGKSFPSVKKIVYPNTVEKIERKEYIEIWGAGWCTTTYRNYFVKNLTKINDNIFYDCSSLRNIEIPENVTEIGNYAFYNSGITNIEIPSSVTSIGNSAFAECNELNNIEIPDSVTRIDDCAFFKYKGCENITKIVIPDSVKYIGDRAFDKWGENNEQTIYFECSEEEAKNWSSDWKGWWFYANIVWDYNPDGTTE